MRKGSLNLFALAAPLYFCALAANAQVPDAGVIKEPSRIYLKGLQTNPADNEVPQLKSLQGFSFRLPVFNPRSDAQFDAIARGFIDDNSSALNLSDNSTRFVLKRVRSTPTGKVVDYEQQLNGVAIIDSHFGVSVARTGQISSVTKNIFRVPVANVDVIAKEAKISEQEALEIVNASLHPSGKVIESPTIEKAYLKESDGFNLVYVVRVAVQQPFGYWEYRIDSQNGRIVEKFDRSVQEAKKRGEDVVLAPNASLPAIDLKLVFGTAAKASLPLFSGALASVKATVFNPNPVTELRDGSLNDRSPPASFTKAYMDVDLADVSRQGNAFSLAGPNVQIRDFEPGEGGRSMPPSTTLTRWSALRGDNAFNDVMTYCHD